MELKKQTEGHPEFANFDDSVSAAGDGMSTLSGTDTPMTAGTPGQPKLKLTFSNANRDSGDSANGAELDDEE
jgi:ATP-dependent helicase STH1/SNF2